MYQEQDGQQKPIAYASRSLSSSETQYPIHKLEFLALKWSVTEKFKEYVYGSRFTVFTDNNPLTYVLSTARLDATGQRWVAELANYNFNIKYRAGRHNIDADALSRITRLQQDSHQGVSDIISVDVVQAICQAVVVSPAYVNCLSMNHQPVNCINQLTLLFFS